MSHPFITACATALALAGAGAHAAPPRPDDATAAVPETRYRALDAYRPAERPATTPNHHWVEANRKVGATNSMMLTMPQPPAPAPAAPGQPAPSAPSAPSAPKAGHDHGSHGSHGSHGAQGQH